MEGRQTQAGPRTLERPALRLLEAGSSESEPGPLVKLEAEAMYDCVVMVRKRVMRLPEQSEVRQEWLAASEDALLAARLLWPSAVPRGAAVR